MRKLTSEIASRIISLNKFQYNRIILRDYPECYYQIGSQYEGKTFSEKLYRWLHPDSNIGKCLECSKECKFDDIFYGFRKHCSLKCSNNSKEVKLLKENNCLKKFGVKNPSSASEIKKKKQKTFIKHYGADCNFRLEKFKQQIRRTNLKKYGTEYPIQSNLILSPILFDNYERFFSDVRYKDVFPLFSKEEYRGVELSYNFKCKRCDNCFSDHLQDGRIPRCLKCYPHYVSKYQKDIADFIRNDLGIPDVVENDRSILGGKEIDIYISSHKVGIEFDGLYYHGELSGGVSRNYHLEKTKKCEAMGIRLIHIFEDEWRLIPDIVKSRIRSLFNATNNKIHGRKCEVRVVSNADSRKFLIENHLQGADHSSVKLGLYLKDDLVSIMTFGALRVSLGSTSKKSYWEMYRFCSKLNNSVVGAAGKLLSKFIQTYNPIKIISYSDKRWGNGNLYLKLGFSKISDSRPSYFYTKDHSKRFHRYGFRKNVLSKKLSLFDPKLSEWENMKINGWDRIWDCGCSKYEFTPHK